MPEAAVKPKFDPNTLTPELREIYDGMLAEYTQKTQAFGKDRDSLQAQIKDLQTKMDEANKSVRYYERMLAQTYGDDGQGQQRGRPNGEDAGPPAFDAFNEKAHDARMQWHINNYHNQLREVYDGLVKGIMELQAYNLQLNRVMLTPVYAKAGIEMPDLQKIIDAAPKYGYDLGQAYRAVYESPDVWKRAQQHPELTKQVEDLTAKIKTLESNARSPMPGVLGGTTGPIPRTVAKGAKPKTYSEIASTISPAEVFSPEGSEPGAVTTGTGGGGTAGQ